MPFVCNQIVRLFFSVFFLILFCQIAAAKSCNKFLMEADLENERISRAFSVLETPLSFEYVNVFPWLVYRANSRYQPLDDAGVRTTAELSKKSLQAEINATIDIGFSYPFFVKSQKGYGKGFVFESRQEHEQLARDVWYSTYKRFLDEFGSKPRSEKAENLRPERNLEMFILKMFGKSSFSYLEISKVYHVSETRASLIVRSVQAKFYRDTMLKQYLFLEGIDGI